MIVFADPAITAAHSSADPRAVSKMRQRVLTWLAVSFRDIQRNHPISCKLIVRRRFIVNLTSGASHCSGTVRLDSMNASSRDVALFELLTRGKRLLR